MLWLDAAVLLPRERQLLVPVVVQQLGLCDGEI